MRYRFGDFLLDTARYELCRSGEPVAVEPQVFGVLVHLIEHRDRVVTKEALIEAIWGGRATSDAALSSRIFAARRAVGDTGQAQTWIQTVQRRGYRFIGRILQETEGAADRGHQPVAATADESEAQAPGGGAHPATALPTLTVLRFRNMSPGLDAYFSDGLIEDIIASLSHFRELRVIAGNSSFRYPSGDSSLPQLVRELGADYVVDGSVRRSGSRLRITVKLIDARSGYALWAGQYDRKTRDLFAMQDAVTQRIAATLGIKVQDAALTRALRKSPSELDAYDCLLHARRYTATLSESMHAEARELLEKAIALDPNYADAYALLANVYLAEHRFDANPRPDPLGRALRMAETATRLDPQNAYAHCWLAIVHFFLGENGKFEAESERALALNPNDPEILADIGHYLAFMGQFERGVELSNRAKQLNPLHPGWYHFSMARFHYHQRAYEAMLEDVQRISMPGFYWTHLLNAAAFGQLGRAEAAESIRQMVALKPGISARDELRKWNAAPDDLAHLLDGLRMAGLEV